MIEFLNWLRWIRREAKRVANVRAYRKASGLPAFNLSEFAQRKTSDTLIVLGSGSSINALSEEDWDTIREHDSIGLNFWLLNQFVPDFYMFEVGPTQDRIDHFQTFLTERAARYESVPMIYKDTDRHTVNLSSVPSMVVHQFRVLNKINLPLDREDRLQAALRWCLRLRIPQITGLHVFARASIVQACALGAMLGYKRIVLAGVDLNNTRYFWSDNPDLNWFGAQPGTVHKTMTSEKLVPVDRVLDAFDTEWFKPAGITLYCGHATSALHPRFPAFFG